MNNAPIETIEFRGGRLCLDFINTTNWIGSDAADDRLTDSNALAVWARRQGLADMIDAEGDLAGLRHLRGALRRILMDPDAGSPDDLALLNGARSGIATIGAATGGLALSPPASIEAIARCVADSAAELLLVGDRARIKTCAGEGCGWLFLDESPNNRRKWCSMADCGNRAKARRHYRARWSTQV